MCCLWKRVKRIKTKACKEVEGKLYFINTVAYNVYLKSDCSNETGIGIGICTCTTACD